METNAKNLINSLQCLCLYCDKSFANIRERENHVDREHKTLFCRGKGGSRKSVRITTKNSSTQENLPFPGCFVCNKRVFKADDLDLLFDHLLTSHKDVYFGCRCKIRKLDKVSLATHKKQCKVAGDCESAKKSKFNGDSTCDSISETEDDPDSLPTPANAIHNNKKSERTTMKVHSKNAEVEEEEYKLPLTRQKLKSSVNVLSTQVRSSKKTNHSVKATKLSDSQTKIQSVSSSVKSQRTKPNKSVNIKDVSVEPNIEQKVEPVSVEFDDDFYRNISQNIRENLNCHVDGKRDRLPNLQVFDQLSESMKIDDKRVNISNEKEIHESTNFEASTPFPALLTIEQYGFGDNRNKLRRQITKNSWKWRWDLIKKYKYINEGGKIVKKVKQVTTGLKDLSQLDMWTQLSMRSRYENLKSNDFDEGLSESLSHRMIKTQNVEQLNAILDKRSTLEIDVEQREQTIIKLEPEERDDTTDEIVDNYHDQPDDNSQMLEMIGLTRRMPSSTNEPLLSGEWARPRCYICLDCGQKFDLMKNLTEHKNSEHPYIVTSHYEVVGRENLERKLFKNLFLPRRALDVSGFARSVSIYSDSKSNETNEASTSSDSSSKFSADQKEKECSKCLKMIKFSSDNDIYRHILECIEDRVWMQAKRRSKYRKSRRKTRKISRKSRPSLDQKKSTSPSNKDNIEGEKNIFHNFAIFNVNFLVGDSNPSLSNPPTPKNDLTTPIEAKKVDDEQQVNGKINGKPKNGTLSIKNFFRVSKTSTITPQPQKLVVQMMEISENNSSLRNSLRSTRNNPKNDKDDESKNDENIDSKNESPQTSIFLPLSVSTPPINQSLNDPQLISPSSNASLTSPTLSNSNVPKKKKKLNDCIAMLTCKIQEKLGVSFFDKPLNHVDEADENAPKEPPIQPESKPKTPSTNFQIASLLGESLIQESTVVQDEVIDLSVKKSSVEVDELKVEEKVEENTLENEIIQVPPINDEHLNITEVVDENETKKEEESMEMKVEEAQKEDETTIVEKDESKVNNIEEISPPRPARKVKKPQPKKKIVRKTLRRRKKVVKIQVENEMKVEDVETTSIQVEENEIEDFRIRIPKRRIPNLKQILEMKNSHENLVEEVQPTVKINNCSLNISDEERRAFEEQKNRIMQILNKTKQNKTPKKKIPTPKKTPVVKKKQKAETLTTPDLNPKEDVEEVREKIEMTIKATNRVRSRRLSVVVDPIIHLSNFQHKNRKIRLTNNSQQNGIYDIFTTNEDLFSNPKIDETPKAAEETNEKLVEDVPTKPEDIEDKSQLDESEEKPKVEKNLKINRGKRAPVKIEEEIPKPATPEPILVEDVLKPRAAKAQAIGLMTTEKPKPTQKKSKPVKLKKISMENSFISDETLNEQSEEMKFDEKPATPGIVEKEDEKIDEKPSETTVKRTLKRKNSKQNEKKLEAVKDNSSIIQNDEQAEEISKENVKSSFNPFTIAEEDSLFNDDDNDPTDKINDIVNNIITEFQIDSETEKSESNATSVDDKNQNSPVCIICRRSFRNEKVYEKHCKTSTHITKVERRERNLAKRTNPKNFEKAPSPIIDEMKIFRTKGALKTFDMSQANVCEQKTQNFDDKFYLELKMEKKPEDMTPKDKDQLFDSLFNSLEENALSCQNKAVKSIVAPVLQDSEIESSSTSWDLKHDAEWDGENADNVPFPTVISEKYPKKFPVKVNKSKDTAVSIPTKSLIMGKIFKKHRDREKQKTPQADAPTNKTGIKNSLDEIFDHLKNTSEIDDRVLTCPSPKTLLRVAGGTFSPNSSNSNDMLESASQSNNNNNNIYKSKTPEKSIPQKVAKESSSDGAIGKRMPRRRCAAKTKTFAETWSSDEYEELHDTEDIISIINEIERRESIKKNKQLTSPQKSAMCDMKSDKKLQFVEEFPSTNDKIAKKLTKEGYKSEEEVFTSSKEILPSKPASSLKKRRMSCFVPSTKLSSFEKEVISPAIMKMEKDVLEKFDKVNEDLSDVKQKLSNHKKSESEKSFVKIKGKLKGQKQRKKPKNRIRNIAYDTDSDYELNLSKKPKTKAPSECIESSDDDDNDNESVITTKTGKSTSSQHMTVLKESKLLPPNDLKPLVHSTTSNHKAAIPEDITESAIKACSRTKRHSSEKLYYWSSSSDSDEDKVQQGDVADMNNEEPATPHQQPEQHGWIVGDSHKKLVTLLAHAKIKNKIN